MNAAQLAGQAVRRRPITVMLQTVAVAAMVGGCAGSESAMVPAAVPAAPLALVESVRVPAEQVPAFGGAATVEGWAPLVANGDDARSAGRSGGILKVGKPYQIGGLWYYPSHQPDYDQIGMASWYGDDFHGKRTANGEIFRMGDLTAAHPTLPLPSLVKVTNLANGRTILVRVNDRGPYKRNRLIDLSREAARLLGYGGAGVAKVRVQYVGKAPLDGSDAKERRYLAAQKWYRPQLASVGGDAAAAAVALGGFDPVVEAEPVQSLVRVAPSQAGRFIVQVGAYRSEANAQRVAQRLRSVGPVRVTAETRGDALIHVVTVGPFNNSGGANDSLAAIVDLGIGDAVIRKL